MGEWRLCDFLSGDRYRRRSGSKTPPRLGQKDMKAGSGGKAPLWASLTATLFGIGYLRPGPGTWGSAVTVLCWWALTHVIPPQIQLWAALAIVFFIVLIGIPAATQVSRASASKDPQFVVIDEVAGQLIALIAAPVTWKTGLAGFILF